MPGDDQNTEIELPTAIDGRPKKTNDTTTTQTGTTSAREARGAISLGTTNEQADLDWMNYQPDADRIYTDRDGNLRHQARPRALRAFSSPAGIEGVHQALNGNGHAAVTQRPVAVEAVRLPQPAALAPT